MLSFLLGIVAVWASVDIGKFYHDGEFEIAESMLGMLADIPINPVVSTGDGDCRQCVNNTGRAIFNGSVDKVIEMCKKKHAEKCPFCKALEKKCPVALGFLAYWVRPFSLGWTYCVGKGECKWNQTESVTDEIIMPEDYMFSQMVRTNGFNMTHKIQHDMKQAALGRKYPKSKGNMMTKIWALLAGKKFGKPHHKDDEEDGGCPCKKPCPCEHGGHGRCPCKKSCPCPRKKCMKKVSKVIMFHVFKQVAKWCAKAKCPKAKMICEWAKAHKGFAIGILIAAVEPWKYAAGYCFPHHRPHHRHHHKKHHHGHHHGDDEQDEQEESEFRQLPEFAHPQPIVHIPAFQQVRVFI